jgi:hypothetical protein
MADLELYADDPEDQKAFNAFETIASSMNSYKTGIDTSFAAAAKRVGVKNFEGLEVPELIWWSQKTPELVGSGRVSGDNFGWSVTISGTTVVAGAPGHGPNGATV